MRRTCLTFLTFVVFAIGPAAYGQLELGIDGGLIDFGNDLVDDEGPRVSLRAAWYFNDYFAVEGQLSHAEADALDTELRTYTVNGILSLRHNSVVQPYMLGGFGFAEAEQDTFQGLRVEDDSESVTGAIGVKSFLDDRETMGLRLEAGFVWEDTFGQNTTHIIWSAGFIYRVDF